MPSPGDADDAALAAAVESGELSADRLAQSAQRILDLVERAGEPDPKATFDVDAHHALAREAAGQAVVLLRNDDVDGAPLLPLTTVDGLAVIGALAAEPRYQGGGSSHVNATRVDEPLAQIRARAGVEVPFAAGYSIGEPDPAAAEEAVELAARSGAVLLFLGLAAHQESEGFDRTDIELPDDQRDLARRVLAANPRTVVVLCHGGVLRLTDLTAPALLDGALLGQAVGSAITDVLFGDVNPSGRLAESVPVRIADTPDYLNFPGEHGHVTYGEGLFVGYRWYDARELAVTFPFGHGLSYTTFAYSDLTVTSGADGLTVELTVTNTGTRDGREVVQVYLGLPGSAVARPRRELRGFAGVVVPQGQSVPVQISMGRDDLAYWDIRVGRFVVEGGDYEVSVGASSRDLRLFAAATVAGDEVRVPLTLDSSLAEVLADPVASAGLTPLFESMMSGMGAGDDDSGAAMGVDLGAMIGSIPVGRLPVFSGGAVTAQSLQTILDDANARR